MMEPLVTIAVPDFAGPVARAKTLAALARHTPEPYEMVLFVERSRPLDTSLRHGGQEVRSIPVALPFSAPSALNRLLNESTAPYLLLLECGALVTAGWLTRLLDALHDTTVGIVGPSTNFCWNEQQGVTSLKRNQWSMTQIDALAAGTAARYAGQRQPLDTLHNLGDFCYLFKRSVAEAVGGFEEEFGEGPCWEIDFGTRAARAGFQAVWVPDAYVHRGTTPSSPISEQLLTRNKRLYQDRFCGLRLRGEKTSYEPHCRGEQCQYFAPPELIKITLDAPKHRPSDDSDSPKPRRKALVEKSHLPPLVSCIMPTRNRRAFISQALAYFERQDYPNKELIVVDDGDDRIEDLLGSHPGVRYVALPKPASIGAKRNLACEIARGAIIAHWDDDDWYAAHRLSYQVEPLIAGKADVTGLETYCFFDLPRWQGWTCSPDLHQRLFVGDVHGGTLVYWRWIWERQAHYPSASLAEDAAFLQSARSGGARLLRLPHTRSFVYIRHENNAWRFPPGTYLSPAGWKKINPDSCMPPEDLVFYKSAMHGVNVG